ncbi:hypothetical protein HGG76_11745 [Ochrobactrum tritici]|uniref:Uncharacterized protein n=1 Tax=Brucella tritici TaxID=94626 RepID=A0A7X6JCE3_9HYPH|nr:hypothetical protein [Brucella tritici]
MQEHSFCDNCLRPTKVACLDGKPTLTRWLRIIRFFRGQAFMLRYAADRGYDFDRLECGDCYGPGYLIAEEV